MSAVAVAGAELARCRASLAEGIATKARASFVRDAEAAYNEAVFRVLDEPSTSVEVVLSKLAFAADPEWRDDVFAALVH